MRYGNLGPVARVASGGPTDPKLVHFPIKTDFLKFFFVNFCIVNFIM